MPPLKADKAVNGAESDQTKDLGGLRKALGSRPEATDELVKSLEDFEKTSPPLS